MTPDALPPEVVLDIYLEGRLLQTVVVDPKVAYSAGDAAAREYALRVRAYLPDGRPARLALDLSLCPADITRGPRATTHDAAGRVTRSSGPRGLVTEYTYYDTDESSDDADGGSPHEELPDGPHVIG